MTGRKNATGRNPQKKRARKDQQVQPNPPQSEAPDDSLVRSPPNVRKEQPPPTQVVKKILKTENDEARTLKTVFKSNPDSQMKDFIRKAGNKANQPVAKTTYKVPAESHPPAVAQDLIEIDDDVADNLGRLFKASKSFKNV